MRDYALIGPATACSVQTCLPFGPGTRRAPAAATSCLRCRPHQREPRAARVRFTSVHCCPVSARCSAECFSSPGAGSHVVIHSALPCPRECGPHHLPLSPLPGMSRLGPAKGRPESPSSFWNGDERKDWNEQPLAQRPTCGPQRAPCGRHGHRLAVPRRHRPDCQRPAVWPRTRFPQQPRRR